ncbi:hypothetical protein [Mesorhizobium sp.]|uniref:hypothetical protein n=2 Tax=Mesorhizobium sp. TaxID=1871066 RepID=UPI000FE8277F|nr:hypothetical protein [Mesorhizobium sp.]RWP29864.1 MAG: hypothetical protein EOR03_25740 [Mesorhizobium sp.]
MPIVSTGQITIVDNNDARPITAYITANPGPQQVFTKDESTVSYTPDWTAGAGLVLTAKVYIGGIAAAEDVTGQLTNRKWSTDLSTALVGTGAAVSAAPTLDAIFDPGTFTVVHSGATSTLTIDANMASTVAQGVIYFEGDYTDPVTGLVSHVVAQIVLGLVKTGTNAVYVVTRGQSAIEQATGSTKTVAVVVADLMRAAGHDTSGVNYRFFEANGATQIITGAPFNTEYGLKTTASGVAPVGALGDIGVNLPAAAAWSAHNTLVIHESAITDMMVFRVEARDADNVVFQTYFTIYDVSDPYQLNILSSTGDKLQNGIGSTVLTPEVYYGATKVASLTGWAFTWTFFNRDGKRGGFIDTTKTAVAGGRTITANTTGVAGSFTYDGAAITWAAGQLIKVINAAGQERFYEIASGTANNVVLRTPVTNAWLNFTDFPAPAVANDFVGGKLFAVAANGGQIITAAAATVTLTGDEVDIKARITCDGNRP